MANPEHLKIFKKGVKIWNKWRKENWELKPDLSEAEAMGLKLSKINLSEANLSKADFSGSKLSKANLHKANLSEANFSEAKLSRINLSEAILLEANFSGSNLSKAKLHKAKLYKANFSKTRLRKADLTEASLYQAQFSEANLSGVDLSEADLLWASFFGANLSNADFSSAKMKETFLPFADLTGANLFNATLFGADFSGADLSGAHLATAQLIKTNLSNAKLERANIYGISAWDINKDGLIQKDLIITPPDQPEITVDDLEVAQFIYLMLNNEKIRNVIETITSKAVLILGRFTPDRKAVLDAIKDELRLRNYLPIVFDFENVGTKSIDETINLLARMSRFVIADITDAKSIPQELRGFVPENPSIPIVPLIWKEQCEYGMFDYFRSFPWVLPLHEYESPEQLMKNIIDTIIAPVEQKVLELKHK